MWDLVGHHEDRFSHNKAHIVSMHQLNNYSVYDFFFFREEKSMVEGTEKKGYNEGLLVFE